MKVKYKHIKKYVRALLIIAISATSLSIGGPNPYIILTEEDYRKQIFDREEGPALSAVPNGKRYWESFNEWRCFSTQNIKSFECSELDYGLIGVPTLRVQVGEELYDFSLDPEPRMNCDALLNEWATLLAQEDAFCTFSAYLQELPDDSFSDQGVKRWSLWILDRIKSSKGYWESRFYGGEETGDSEI